MSRRYFSKEEEQWLIDNFEDHSYKELTDMFNEKFGTDYQWSRDIYPPIERKCRKLGLKKNKSYGFTEEEDIFIKQHASKYSNSWMAKRLEELFGRKHTEEALKMHSREWLGINKKNGWKGEDYICPTKRPVGSICSWGGSRCRIKILDTGDAKVDWYPYGRYIYENHHGVKLPEDYQVIHLDGDQTNFEISNLEAVNHREHAILTANNWHGKEEVTRTGIAYAKLILALKDC